MKKLPLLLIALMIWACDSPKQAAETKEPKPIQLDKLKMPKGFGIEIWATDVENARSMCLSPSGTLFVGTRDVGNVYALRDTSGDGKPDKKYIIASHLSMPNGVAFRNGSLYVAEVGQILRYDNIESKLGNPGKPKIIFKKYPDKEHHGWKYIAFGPDGKLYVPVGVPCNICEPDEEIFGTITRMNPDGTGMEIVQRGIRNSVGLTWRPGTEELWFTDNGRDWMGDDMPECELNVATHDGMHFGFPYCHQGDTLDTEFAGKHTCDEFEPPVQKMGAHVAPLGLEFYTGKQFPPNYLGQLFVALHGSWNRTSPSGYRIECVNIENGKAVGHQPFIEGWLGEDGTPWGRPVDIEQLPDGSMLISDDFAGVIYRVFYKG